MISLVQISIDYQCETVPELSYIYKLAAISMTSPSKVVNSLIIILLCSCTVNTTQKSVDDLNLTDTVYNAHIISVNNGDTIWQRDTIYFTPTSTNDEMSNFFYEACEQPCSAENSYKIYFKRERVIEFCDSLLAATPVYKNEGDEDIFFARLIYDHLREQAVKNKMDDSYYVDELTILLERFSPLIINHTTSDKPKYMIIKNEDRTSWAVKTYNIKSKTGDTIVLNAITTRTIEIPQHQ